MGKKLLIVGGGPAGLSAAINAASEGLDVTILDGANRLGGQFKESNDIQNYPGFAEGTNGAKLSEAMIAQAAKFGVKFECPAEAEELEVSDAPHFVVRTNDWREFKADAVILALGLQWAQLEAPGVSEFMGRGVSYGAPSRPYTGKRAVLIGGGNSAGQQAVKLGKDGVEVAILVRGVIADTMSKYLIDQIEALPNVLVLEHTELTGVFGSLEVTGITTTADPKVTMPCDAVMIYIGASPRTLWLRDSDVELDSRHYITTGLFDNPSYQTSVPGVFAIGDARSGSCKRIGAAVGEGSTVVPYVHKFLAANP